MSKAIRPDRGSAIFGSRIRQLRQAKGWTQYELAAEIDMERCRLSDWERGATLPTFQHYARLVDALGIERDDLLKTLPEDAAPPAPASGGV